MGHSFFHIPVIVTVSVMVLASHITAQTNWTGNTSNVINNNGNWDNGVPNNTDNPGTYSGDGSNAMVITASSQINNRNIGFIGGNPSGSGFLVVSGSALNFETGATYTHSISGELSANTGSNFTVNGATMTFNDNTSFGVRQNANTAVVDILAGNVSAFNVGNSASDPTAAFNMSGGNVTVTNQFGGNGIHNLTGGVVDGSGNSNLFFGNTATKFNISGSFTVENFNGFAGSSTNRVLDIAPGWSGALTLGGSADWAEAEWNSDRLLFNGQNGTTLGLTWSDVTNPSIGLNGTEYFTFDGTMETLALALVPEPTTAFLILLGLGFIMLPRRRRVKATKIPSA